MALFDTKLLLLQLTKKILGKYFMRFNKFLQLFKTRGPLTARDIAEHMSITNEGARQQLVRLAEAGLIKAQATAKGIGRPVQVYELTAEGHARFPNNHASLTVELLATIREQLGEDALNKIVDGRTEELIKKYSVLLKSYGEIETKMAAYATIRTEEGYMAELVIDAEGEFTFIENNCPICAAALNCGDFCHSDMRILQELLGPDATIERRDHIIAGERRCTYKIYDLTKRML